MIATDFDAVRLLLRISEDRISAARQALVDGQTLASIAKRYRRKDGQEWTRQAVGDAVRVVWQTFVKFKQSERLSAQAQPARTRHAPGADVPLPSGWVEVTLRAPESLVAKFRSEIAAADTAINDLVPTSEPSPKKKARRAASTPGKAST